MAGVQFLLDGANLGAEVTGPGPTYTFSWNTATAGNGAHTVSARARDAASNTAIAASVNITVFNDTTPPVVSLTAPGAGATLNGTISLVASASDNGTLAGVQFRLDGVDLGAEVTGTGPTYTYSWNTTTATNGPHTLSARARDAATNTALAANVNITVFNDTTPPVVSLTAPGAGATLNGTISIVASASDNGTLAGVQFRLDGANLGAEVTGTGPTYTYQLEHHDGDERTAHVVGARARCRHQHGAGGERQHHRLQRHDAAGRVADRAGSGRHPQRHYLDRGLGVGQRDPGGRAVPAGRRQPRGRSDGRGPTYTYTWNTTTTTDGAHTVSARARDAANNTATAANLRVTVANVAARLARRVFVQCRDRNDRCGQFRQRDHRNTLRCDLDHGRQVRQRPVLQWHEQLREPGESPGAGGNGQHDMDGLGVRHWHSSR